MTKIPFVGGPKDGDVLHLTPGMPQPIEIRHKGWRGHYEFRSASGPESSGPLGPHLLWREAK